MYARGIRIVAVFVLFAVLGIPAAWAAHTMSITKPKQLARAFRLVGSAGWILSTGRYVVLGSPGNLPATVIDDQRGSASVVPQPGCQVPISDYGLQLDQGDQWLPLICGSDQRSGELRLYAFASGQMSAIQLPAQCRQQFGGFTGYSCGAMAIGVDWIEYVNNPCAVEEHYCYSFLYQNIPTATTYHGKAATGPHTIPNLNSARLAERVCQPLRVPGPYDTGTPALSLYGQVGLIFDPNNYLYTLQRCNQRARLSLFDFGLRAGDSHALFWTTQDPKPGQPLRGFYLPGLKAFSIRVPTSVGTPFAVALGSRNLYILNTNDQIWQARRP